MASQHEQVELFLSTIVKSVRDDIDYAYARQSDFNSIPDKSIVCCTLDPLNHLENPNTNFTTDYPVNMFFYMQDDKDGTEAEWQERLNKTAEIVEIFTRKLNRAIEDEDQTEGIRTDNTSMSPVQVSAAIRVLADCFTGWTVSFTLTIPDTFNYCAVYDS